MQRQPLSSSSELSGHLAFTKCHWQASLRPCSLIKVPNQHSTFSNIFSNFFKLLETLRASAAEPQHNQHPVSACDQVSYTGPPWDLYFIDYMSMCLLSFIHWWGQLRFWFDLSVPNYAVQPLMPFCSFSKRRCWTSLGGFCCLGFQLAEVLTAAHSLLMGNMVSQWRLDLSWPRNNLKVRLKVLPQHVFLHNAWPMNANELTGSLSATSARPDVQVRMIVLDESIHKAVGVMRAVEEGPPKWRTFWFVWKNIAYWYLKIGGSDSSSAFRLSLFGRTWAFPEIDYLTVPIGFHACRKGISGSRKFDVSTRFCWKSLASLFKLISVFIPCPEQA